MALNFRLFGNFTRLPLPALKSLQLSSTLTSASILGKIDTKKEKALLLLYFLRMNGNKGHRDNNNMLLLFELSHTSLLPVLDNDGM